MSEYWEVQYTTTNGDVLPYMSNLSSANADNLIHSCKNIYQHLGKYGTKMAKVKQKARKY